MKSTFELQLAGRALRDKLILSGESPELLRKLNALVDENWLRTSDRVKLARILGEEI